MDLFEVGVLISLSVFLALVCDWVAKSKRVAESKKGTQRREVSVASEEPKGEDRKPNTDILKIQILADYYRAFFDLSASIVAGLIVGLFVVDVTLYFEHVVNLSFYFVILILLLIGLSYNVAIMIRSYQSDLEKIDKLLKRVENGEALKSISELRKELAESIIQKIRDQFKIKRKLMHEQITEEVEDGEHVFRLMVNSKVMCVVRTMPQAGYLGDITTTQGERRKGYGKNLLTHVEKITKQHKAQTIETTDIDPLDYDTICFFKGVGYEIEKIEDDKRGFVKAVKNL